MGSRSALGRGLRGLILVAAVVQYASAFHSSPGCLQLRRAGAFNLNGVCFASGATCAPRTLCASDSRAKSRPGRAGGGVQGLRAQTDIAANVAASVASGASSLSGAAVLCGVIAFHELGHFLAAKVQGIRINDFSIGFGPKLVGFQDRDGVTYSFRLFPLGGFVSFPEGIEQEEDASAEGSNDASDEDEQNAKVYDFDDPDLIQNRPALQRALVISAGVIFNMILSYMAIFASVTTIGVSTPVVLPGVAVPGIADPNGAAARYGLEPGDVIVRVNGRDLLSGDDSVREVVQTVKDSKGRTLHFMVQRAGAEEDDAPEAVDVVPDKSADGNGVIGVRLATNIASVETEYASGPSQALAMTNSEFQKLFSSTAAGFLKLFSNLGANAGNLAGPVGVMQMGTEASKQGALLSFAALISLNLGLMNAIPLPALDGMNGPARIRTRTHDLLPTLKQPMQRACERKAQRKLTEQDARQTAGGQLLLIMVEAARGRPLNANLTRTVNGLFLTLLLCVSLSMLVNDIERMIPPSLIKGLEGTLGL